MKRRIWAWLALIGFILLILDISFFKYKIEIALGIYTLIIIYFLFSNFKK